MKSSYSTRRNGASVDSMMTPMIDVVFLLLVFFLATSSFQRLEKTLPSSVATAPVAQQQGSAAQIEFQQAPNDLSDVVVRILRKKDPTQSGEVDYTVNGEPISSLELLAGRLSKMIKVRSDIPLIIDPEDDVAAGEAVRVYDLAKASGSVAVYLVAR